MVGANRYIFGERDMCRIDDGEFEDRFIPDPWTVKAYDCIDNSYFFILDHKESHAFD